MYCHFLPVVVVDVMVVVVDVVVVVGVVDVVAVCGCLFVVVSMLLRYMVLLAMCWAALLFC